MPTDNAAKTHVITVEFAINETDLGELHVSLFGGEDEKSLVEVMTNVLQAGLYDEDSLGLEGTFKITDVRDAE